jgi:choline dehydrogenase-like flavoprotein
VRRTTGTYFHPYGSCRIGQGVGSPLDVRSSVKGVTGLRVMDASAIPGRVSANPHFTVLAMAERVADLMAEDRA